MKYDEHFRNKLYGGVIGKYIGVMHGAEIESWTWKQTVNFPRTIKIDVRGRELSRGAFEFSNTS